MSLSGAMIPCTPDVSEAAVVTLGATAATNVATLNAALLTNSWVVISTPGTYEFNASILIPSNCRLTINPGVTLKLAAASLTYLIRNRGTSGATSTWLTGNTNIIIDGGGSLDFNYINNLATPGNIGASLDNWISMGLYLINCTKVKIQNLTITGAPYNHTMKINKYLCYFTGGGDIWCDNLTLNNTSDGLHFHGDQYNIKVTNCSGWTNDDFIGVTPSNGGYSNYTPIGITEGSLNGIEVDNIRQWGNGTALLLYGADYLGVKYPVVNAKVSRLYSKPVVTVYNNPTTLTSTGTGGTFTLSYGGQTTSAIAWNATHAQIKTALEALSTIGTGNIGTVTGASVISATAIEITIGGVTGSLAGQTTTAITIDNTLLTGGTGVLSNVNTNTNPTFRFSGVWGLECDSTYGWIPRANSVFLGVFDAIESPTSLPCKDVVIRNTVRRDQEALGATLGGSTSTGRIFTTNTEFRANDIHFDTWMSLTNEGLEGAIHNNGSQPFNLSVTPTRTAISLSASRTLTWTAGVVTADATLYSVTMTAGGASPGNFLTDGIVVGDTIVTAGMSGSHTGLTLTVTAVTATMITANTTSASVVVGAVDSAGTITYYAGYITNFKVSNGRHQVIHPTTGYDYTGTAAHIIYNGLGVGFNGAGAWTGTTEVTGNFFKNIQGITTSTDNGTQTLRLIVANNKLDSVSRGVVAQCATIVSFSGNVWSGTTPSYPINLAAATNANNNCEVRWDSSNYWITNNSTTPWGNQSSRTIKSLTFPNGVKYYTSVATQVSHSVYDGDHIILTTVSSGTLSIRLCDAVIGQKVRVSNYGTGSASINVRGVTAGWNVAGSADPAEYAIAINTSVEFLATGTKTWVVI